jgi:hypothetical protein
MHFRRNCVKSLSNIVEVFKTIKLTLLLKESARYYAGQPILIFENQCVNDR